MHLSDGIVPIGLALGGYGAAIGLTALSLARIRRQLIALLAARRQAMLIASHDLDLVLALCARVIVLDQSRICADGPARDLLSDPALMAAHGQEVPTALRTRP